MMRVLRVALVACLACLSLGLVATTAEARLSNKYRSSLPPSHVRPRRAAVNLRPIIGILTLANSDDPSETGSNFSAGYVKWLEQAGMRVAVVPFNAPTDMLDDLFAGINGLLFTGGGLSLNSTTVYYQTASYLWNRAMKANDDGDFFPIWGTCQGFQLMNLLAGAPKEKSDVLKCIYDSYNLRLPLNLTSAASSSQLLGPAQMVPAIMDGVSAKPSIYDVLGSQAITQNMHHCSVSPVDFSLNPRLPNFFTVLSTNVDRAGREFISTVEGVRYPFWAAQWHAERTQFEWDLAEVLMHDAQAIAAVSFVSQRFAMLVRQSTHTFPTQAEEEAALIYNYSPVYNGNSTTDSYPEQQVYHFDFEWD